MVSTFIGIYSEIFGLSGVEVGVIGSAYSLTQVVILYPIGRFADLGKRKILLLAGLILGVPTYIAFWQVTGFATLFGARLLQGTTIALTTAIGLSFISIRKGARVNTGGEILGHITPCAPPARRSVPSEGAF